MNSHIYIIIMADQHPKEDRIKPSQTGGKAKDDEDEDEDEDVDDIDLDDLDLDDDGDIDEADDDVDEDPDDGEDDIKEYEETNFQAEDPDEDPCDVDLLTDMDMEMETTSLIVNSSSTIRTTKYLTKYEKSRVLGLRSQQIKSGAPPMLRADALDPISHKYIFRNSTYPVESYDIALKELEYGLCPIIIARRLPNGEKILVSASTLKYV